MKKEIWFGLSILLAIVVALFVLMPAQKNTTRPGRMVFATMV